MDKAAEKQAELQEKLRALEALFAERLPDRLREIDAALDAWIAAPAADAALADLHRFLHSISGTAGTFGFVELGERARKLEGELVALQLRQPRTDADISVMHDTLRAFSRWAAGLVKHSAAATVSLAPAAHPPESGKALYLMVGSDAAADLSSQLQHFGFTVVLLPGPGSLAAEVEKNPPCAIVMELDHAPGAAPGDQQIAHVHGLLGQRVPVVIVSEVGSFEARLSAVRAGSDGYFPMPVDVVALSHRIDTLTRQTVETPYRILSVDDDEVGAEYHATVLRSAGMEVKSLTNPGELLRVLGEFRPELILMDVYMPDYSGVELAQMIRQDNTYLDVPIVFLSSEHDQYKQMSAVEAGADDFLVKPIDAAHLVAAVTHRAKRYRALRGLIMRDSLTGLFNHSAIKEHMLREVARAQRAKLPLSLAVLDIDFFKRVNDGYGHMTGDQVLRALARLLQQWMRRTDIIGRYGGEEFVIILPGTTADNSVGVLNNVREAFSKVRHHVDGREFNATFSVGLAELGPGSTPDSLFRAADEAMYTAKYEGRNRVVRA